MRAADSCDSRRAYSGRQGESVTRGDRRRRELEIRQPVSAARLPARIDGASHVLDSPGKTQNGPVFIGANAIVVLLC